ncbi:MAG: abortive infection system antitoxin AbiGi family protein [Bacteroidota bacterium]|nr:abortive infection system antitoxin AbiGi family protein [Bacteroidota bacterium]
MPYEINTGSNVSSNTLFHFTSSIDNLLNILENEFSPRFCPENKIGHILNPNNPYVAPEYAYPMVCFCDLPLSLIKNNISFYGNYGIGLRKEWGIRNGISPVHYVHYNSNTIHGIEDIFFNLMSDTQTGDPENGLIFNTDVSNDIKLLLRYLKPYTGSTKKNDTIYNDRNFYNEREWRFVPIDDNYAPIVEINYNEFVSLSEENKKLEHIKISFTPSDIKYIIVQRDIEVLQMVTEIRRIKAKYSEDEKMKLITRITTVEAIEEDI